MRVEFREQRLQQSHARLAVQVPNHPNLLVGLLACIDTLLSLGGFFLIGCVSASTAIEPSRIGFLHDVGVAGLCVAAILGIQFIHPLKNKTIAILSCLPRTAVLVVHQDLLDVSGVHNDVVVELQEESHRMETVLLHGHELCCFRLCHTGVHHAELQVVVLDEWVPLDDVRGRPAFETLLVHLALVQIDHVGNCIRPETVYVGRPRAVLGVVLAESIAFDGDTK